MRPGKCVANVKVNLAEDSVVEIVIDALQEIVAAMLRSFDTHIHVEVK
jgi:hypothetical protein